ncbi:uncharacterized protein LOC123260127 [Cotesia glomerata]|uniref:uncharacterized protein LOC123260127 n=1 Tax=Cotesia glomerata TaxID=32391 RepID=UPI001D0238C5|nr:uncharacterized protein LOC123260127 [Cotesia glomerata]
MDDEERANECKEAVRHNTLNGPPINMRDQMPLRYYAFVTRHASKYMLSASFHVNAFVSHPLKWALSTLLSGILFTYVTFTSSYYHLTYTVIYEPSTITSKDLQPLHEPLICRQNGVFIIKTVDLEPR